MKVYQPAAEVTHALNTVTEIKAHYENLIEDAKDGKRNKIQKKITGLETAERAVRRALPVVLTDRRCIMCGHDFSSESTEGFYYCPYCGQGMLCGGEYEKN